MRGETKLQRQLIFLCVGHESPFKVKIKLKQAVAVATGGEIWHTVTEPGSEIKEGTLPEGGWNAAIYEIIQDFIYGELLIFRPREPPPTGIALFSLTRAL